jgi:hypothetical protein
MGDLDSIRKFIWPTLSYFLHGHATHSAVVVKINNKILVTELGAYPPTMKDYFTGNYTSTVPMFVPVDQYIKHKTNFGYTVFHHKCKRNITKNMSVSECKDNVNFTPNFLSDDLFCNLSKIRCKENEYICTSYVNKIMYNLGLVDEPDLSANMNDIYKDMADNYEDVVMVTNK